MKHAKRRGVNWVKPVFDLNNTPMQSEGTGQSDIFFMQLFPPALLSHNLSFLKSNMLLQLLSSWSNCLFPLQDPACLWCPPKYRGVKNNLKSWYLILVYQQTTRLRPGLLASLSYTHASPPGMHRLKAASISQHFPRPVSGRWLQSAVGFRCPPSTSGHSVLQSPKAWLVACFEMKALEKLLEISMSILGDINKCSMKLAVDLPSFHNWMKK